MGLLLPHLNIFLTRPMLLLRSIQPFLLGAKRTNLSSASFSLPSLNPYSIMFYLPLHPINFGPLFPLCSPFNHKPKSFKCAFSSQISLEVTKTFQTILARCASYLTLSLQLEPFSQKKNSSPIFLMVLVPHTSHL